MQAIITKYHGPTNTKGARISARCAAGSISIPYPSELSGEACFKRAAEQLQIKLGWIGKNYGALVGAGLPNGDYVFVMVPAVDALGHLLQYAVGNRGDREGNPYMKTEIEDSLKAMQWVNGCADWRDAADQYQRKGA